MERKDKGKTAPVALTKDNPDFYKLIAKMAGQALKKKYGKGYFSKLAARSHPRSEYRGGRPRKKDKD